MRPRILLAIFTAAAFGCGGSKPADSPAAASAAPAATPVAAAATSPAPAAQAPRKTVNAVGFEALLPFLPEVEGWTRSSPRGEQVTAGVPMSRASARYEQGEALVDVEVLDSAFHELVLAPISSYLTAGFAERMTHGYRKAASINGQPGFEEWNSNTRRAQVTVVVSDRFIVNAMGRNVDSADLIREIVQRIPLGQVATLNRRP